jgi:hypothetical protein
MKSIAPGGTVFSPGFGVHLVKTRTALYRGDEFVWPEAGAGFIPAAVNGRSWEREKPKNNGAET